jgi:phosphoglycolate phosphatase-like HAD superfamily hydrolase
LPIKLVCFDLDGTINDGWSLVKPLEERMHRLRAGGIKLAIVTGREAVATLFFVHRSAFPFDFIGCGGGPIIRDPLSKGNIAELFDDISTYGIFRPGPKKHERVGVIAGWCGVSPEEVLFVDDNDNGSLDTAKTISGPQYKLACPRTNNVEWRNGVLSRGGLVSDKPCGFGTLEILNTIFGG